MSRARAGAARAGTTGRGTIFSRLVTAATATGAWSGRMLAIGSSFFFRTPAPGVYNEGEGRGA